MENNIQSEWHSIRPWTPRISLIVREITSVSATFILSSSLSDSPIGKQPEPSLTSLGLITGDSDEVHSHSDSDVEDSDEAADSPRALIVSDALAKGLRVFVNSSPWQRVLIRIDDKADEAIIIIYGLMPGRQYDIDLGLVPRGQNGISLRRQVITEDSNQPATIADVGPILGPSSSIDRVSSQTSVASTTSHLPLPTPPQSPSPSIHTTHITLEERNSQLQHTLSQLHSERTSLTASLKSTRRDAQKADAALRSQIDTLKRASEKHMAAEHRAKQKILALQEAIKRAQAATTEMETLVKEVEDALPQLQIEKKEKEGEYETVLTEAEKVRGEMEREMEIGKKRVERSDGELAALGNRLERINAKREKLEGGTIPDLEEELREVQREIENVQRDPYEYTQRHHDDSGEDSMEMGIEEGIEDGDGWDPRFSYLPMQRSRQHSQGHVQPLGHTSRSSVTPIQRPSSSHVHTASNPTTSSLQSHRNSLEPPFVFQPPFQAQTQTQLPSQPIHLHSQSRSQAQFSATVKTPARSSTTSTTTVSPTPPLPGTTLSSKAPPFEPGRGPPTHTTRASFPGFNSSAGGGGVMSSFQWPAAGGSGSGSRKSTSKWPTGMGSMDGSK